MSNRIIIFFLMISLLAGISSAAVSMQVSPTSINPGDTIQITYSELLDGTPFSLLIRGKLDVIPNSDYLMDVNTFVLPISLSGGTVSAYADNSKQLSLNYESADSTIRSITQLGNAENKCTITQSQDISAKTYANMWVQGKASTGNSVNTEISFLGTKSGPNSGTISFILSGIDHSTINIICRVDGAIITNTPVYVGGGSVNTPTPNAPAGNTGSPGGATGPSKPSAGALIQNPGNPEDNPSSSYENQQSGDSERGVSVDGQFMYTGKGASDAIIMYESSVSVPADWKSEGQTYALISNGNGVDGTVGFMIPLSLVSSGDIHRLFIAELVNGKYVPLPSVIKGDFIETSVSKEGTFALMSIQDGISKKGPSESKAPVQPDETKSGSPAIMCLITVGLSVAFCQRMRK